MKTLLKITAVLLILVMAFATVASFSARTISGILGDADNDGTITILDATRIQRALVGLLSEDDMKITEILGDSDGNGLDILDATRVQRYLAGFTITYPIGQRQDFEIEDPTEVPTELPTKKDPYELPLVD